MRVIDTPFVYHLTWHREKNRGTEIKPRVELCCEAHLARAPTARPPEDDAVQKTNLLPKPA